MSFAPKVKVTGLKEVRRDLRRLAQDDQWKPGLRTAGKRAADPVVQEAKSIAGGTRAGHEAIDTIRALASQTGAQVAGGSARVVWFVGWNFGSSRYKQFPPKQEPDYFLYTAVKRRQQQVVEIYADEIDHLLRGYFP